MQKHETQFFQSRTPRGFTLVEILIVVVILGILAAIAVPKLSNATQVAREGSLKDNLRFMRTQITVYRSQHRDVFPGFPAGDMSRAPTTDDFTAQMTQYTDDFGNTSATQSNTFKWGPYVPKMPDNPVNSKNTVKLLGPTDTMTADDSTGWLYQPTTGLMSPNVSGSDSEGHPYSDY